jgi:hypothetical protein
MDSLIATRLKMLSGSNGLKLVMSQIYVRQMLVFIGLVYMLTP